MQRRTFFGAVAAGTLVGAAPSPSPSAPPLRLGMAGLVHGHASGFLARYRDSKAVEIVGISEPNREAADRYARQSRIDPATMSRSLDEMLDRARPQAVVVFTSTADHPAVVVACAKRKIPVMMEKPLAIGVEQARVIERAAAESGIPVLVNYETTWYPSNHGALRPGQGKRRPSARSARSWSMTATAGPGRSGCSRSSSPGSPTRTGTAPGPSSTSAATAPT